MKIQENTWVSYHDQLYFVEYINEQICKVLDTQGYETILYLNSITSDEIQEVDVPVFNVNDKVLCVDDQHPEYYMKIVTIKSVINNAFCPYIIDDDGWHATPFDILPINY